MSAFRDFDKRRDIALARSVITENFYMWYAIVIDPLSTLTPNRALSLAFTGIASALRYVLCALFVVVCVVHSCVFVAERESSVCSRCANAITHSHSSREAVQLMIPCGR